MMKAANAKFRILIFMTLPGGGDALGVAVLRRNLQIFKTAWDQNGKECGNQRYGRA